MLSPNAYNGLHILELGRVLSFDMYNNGESPVSPTFFALLKLGEQCQAMKLEPGC